MKVIVHYPNTEQGAQELAKRVAKTHAEAAARYIEKLPCPKEQKEALFDEIMQRGKKKNRTPIFRFDSNKNCCA